MITKFKATLRMSNIGPDGIANTADNIIHKMQASSYFPVSGLPVPYATLTTAVNNLRTAIAANVAGGAGTTSNMKEKARLVISMFGIVRSYVEYIANTTSDPKTVIESAGMIAIAKNGGANAVTELTLVAKGGGVIEITVPRAKGEVAFIYEYSTDAGVTWNEVVKSKLSTTTLDNLTPATIVHFRFTPIGNIEGTVSQPKSIIVL